jgi:uncharacterized protein (DUF2236 family)
VATRHRAADVGLFGPDSVTWRIHSDPSTLLGGGRALLVEALHPTTMAVFDQNTDYEHDPWGRLWRTSEWFATVTFADTATAEAAGAGLRSVHQRLSGVDPLTGRLHRADEPELLQWVHATAVHSFLTAYRRYGGRLSDADADRYVAEMVRIAELVGLPPSAVPANLADLRAYLESVQGLAVTPAARRGMMLMLLSPPIPKPLWPTWAIVYAALVAILPGRVRTLYGLPWLPPGEPPLRATVYALTRLAKVVIPRPAVMRAALNRAA